MTRATVLQEVRQMRFEELHARRQRRDLTMAEAAEMLGVTERTFRRWSTRYEAEGMEGLEDRRLGRVSLCKLFGVDGCSLFGIGDSLGTRSRPWWSDSSFATAPYFASGERG